MRRASRTRFACLAAVALLATIGVAKEKEKPKDLGLVEKAGTRLVQIDLSVTRRDGSPVDVQPGDLEVKVGKTLVRDFTLDRICSPAAPTAPATVASAPASTPAIASYLFYFDEPHMTYAGRDRALDVARELVRTLVVGGNRGIVISNGRDLVAFSGLTDDSGKLLAALDRLQLDTSRQDNYAELERVRAGGLEQAASDEARQSRSDEAAYERATGGYSERVQGVTPNNAPRSMRPKTIIHVGDMQKAGDPREQSGYESQRSSTASTWYVLEDMAKELQRDEMHRAESALDRFRLALLRLSGVRAPKAVVYFADNLRLNAGAHYFQTLDKAMSQEGAYRSRTPEYSGVRDVEGYFGRAIEMAGNVGARVYAVQAAGMTADGLGLRDAKDTLSSLSLETGGKAFLEGVSMASIAGTISRDMECLYLVSFPPGSLPQDQPLPVRIAVSRPDAVVRARSRIVVPSEKTLAESRRLSAFLEPRANGAALSLGAVPVGFDGRKYSELFQVAIPDGGPEGAAWTVSAAIVSKGSVVQEFERSVTARHSAEPLVVEHVLTLPPGVYQVVAVAENAEIDTLLSGQFEVVGPEAGNEGAVVTAPVALQPGRGWFLRDDRAPRSTGSVVRVEGEPLKSELPTALVGYVCRGKGESRPSGSSVTWWGRRTSRSSPSRSTRPAIPAPRCGT